MNTDITKITGDLVPIQMVNNKQMTVDSRVLHEKLHVTTRYNDWITRRIEECGFEEGFDFYSNLSKSTGGRRPVNYTVTLDVAKELAMLENNEIGRYIRRYFIEVEKRYRDWIGIWLPQIEQHNDLFTQRTDYNYGQLLLALGANTSKAAFRSRINRNRQEFWKTQGGVWYVSDEYGKNIVLYHLARQSSRGTLLRRLDYQQRRLS